MATLKSEQRSPQHQTPTKSSPSSSTNLQQSPRNVPNAISSGTYVSTGPIEVSQALRDGEKFVKWDEVCFNFIT